MKKSLLSLAGIALAVSTIGGVANAQLDISDLFYEGTPLVDGAHSKLLNEYDSTWGYSDSSTVSCDSNGQISITSPIIEDETMDRANIYNLFLSPYRVNNIKAWDPTIDVSKIIMKKVELGDSDENINFLISASDVDPNTVYYGFISPANMFDVVGTPSKEICFQIANNVCLQDSACDDINAVADTVLAWEVTEEEHNAASDCVWMDLANVTHTVKWDTVTLKWTAVDGDTVQIAIFDKDAEVYKNLWSVKMSDEKFDYKMQWDWEQNFMLTNGCKELYYKADAAATQEPEKIVPAATGPAENILYIALAAIILYGAYVMFFRKADNK